MAKSTTAEKTKSKRKKITRCLKQSNLTKKKQLKTGRAKKLLKTNRSTHSKSRNVTDVHNNSANSVEGTAATKERDCMAGTKISAKTEHAAALLQKEKVTKCTNLRSSTVSYCLRSVGIRKEFSACKPPNKSADNLNGAFKKQDKCTDRETWLETFSSKNVYLNELKSELQIDKLDRKDESVNMPNSEETCSPIIPNQPSTKRCRVNLMSGDGCLSLSITSCQNKTPISKKKIKSDISFTRRKLKVSEVKQVSSIATAAFLNHVSINESSSHKKSKKVKQLESRKTAKAQIKSTPTILIENVNKSNCSSSECDSTSGHIPSKIWRSTSSASDTKNPCAKAHENIFDKFAAAFPNQSLSSHKSVAHIQALETDTSTASVNMDNKTSAANSSGNENSTPSLLNQSMSSSHKLLKPDSPKVESETESRNSQQCAKKLVNSETVTEGEMAQRNDVKQLTDSRQEFCSCLGDFLKRKKLSKTKCVTAKRPKSRKYSLKSKKKKISTASKMNSKTETCRPSLSNHVASSKPKLVVDAFQLWQRENRRHYQQLHPDASTDEVIAKMKEKWNNLCDSEQRIYIERARDGHRYRPNASSPSGQVCLRFSKWNHVETSRKRHLTSVWHFIIDSAFNQKQKEAFLKPINREADRRKLKYLKATQTRGQSNEEYLQELENDVFWEHMSKKQERVLKSFSTKISQPDGKIPLPQESQVSAIGTFMHNKYLKTFQIKYDNLVEKLIQGHDVLVADANGHSDPLSNVLDSVTSIEKVEIARSAVDKDLSDDKLQSIIEYLKEDEDKCNVGDFNAGETIVDVPVLSENELVKALEESSNDFLADSDISHYLEHELRSEKTIHEHWKCAPLQEKFAKADTTKHIETFNDMVKEKIDDSLCCFLDCSSCFLTDLLHCDMS